MSFVNNVIAAAIASNPTTKADANTLVQSYNSLNSTLSTFTGGKVKLPAASSILSATGNSSSLAKSVLTALGLGDYIGDTDHVNISSATSETGAFKWVEMATTPDSFATADSTILFAGDPIYANVTTGSEFAPIGACQSFAFSIGMNVTPVKELRCEDTLIFPGKAQAGQLAISRFCGNFPSLTYRMHLKSGWGYNAQSTNFKPLFGIMAIFFSPSRKNKIQTLYFERCAITSASVSLNAGQYQIADNVNITFGRCITVGETTTSSTSNNIFDTFANMLGTSIGTALQNKSSSTGDTYNSVTSATTISTDINDYNIIYNYNSDRGITIP